MFLIKLTVNGSASIDSTFLDFTAIHFDKTDKNLIFDVYFNFVYLLFKSPFQWCFAKLNGNERNKVRKCKMRNGFGM